MPTYPFMQVDAFTEAPLGGNPCAVIFDCDDMDEATMLAVAREMNLSETAFVLGSEVADFRARYFTPAEEIPLAGHPTIATAYALVASGRLNLTGMLTTISLELQVGPVEVEIQAACDIVQRIVMTQKKPQFLATIDPVRALAAFGLGAEDALPEAPVQVVSTGTPQLMVPVVSHEALRKAQMDVAAYNRLREEFNFFSPHLFCLQGATARGDTFARHFGTPPDLMEDPFTGSATGGMAAYLWRYGLIESPVFNAEQGHWMGRPGEATVEVLGPPEDIESVKVGGAAAAVMEGKLVL